MRKILLFCSITFILPVFSMDEGIKELFEAVKSEDVGKIKEIIFKYPNLSEIKWDKDPNLQDGKNIIQFAREAINPEIGDMVWWGMITNSNQKKFFKAVEAGRIAEIKHLLPTKAIDVNIVNDEGDSALMIAVKNKNTKLAKELLRLGASIDRQYNKKGQTALTLAIISKNSEMVTTLLNNAQEVVSIDRQDAEGNTSFLLAMQNYDKKIVEALLPEIPNPFMENKEGKIAADFAKSPEQKALLALAQGRYNLYVVIGKSKATKDDIEKLIDSQLTTPKALKNITSIARNPLIQAIGKDRLDIVMLLVDKGADVNQKLTFGVTPLLIAVGHNKSEIVRFLLEKKADSKAVFTDSSTSNTTLLMIAADQGNVDIAKMLLTAGIDPLLKNSAGKTALDYAQKQISSASVQEKDNFKEVINLLFISYVQHFTEALNMLQGALS